MSAEHWRRIEEIYQAALATPPEERSSFLTQVCADDASARAEVESLLAHDSAAAEFLETPALMSAARAIADDCVPLPAGTTIGGYQIQERLGTGGMGHVYRARDARLGRDVAVKIISPLLVSDDARRRLEREARLLASVNHPNIAAIYDVQQFDGGLALVLELIDGPSLAETMRQRRTLRASLMLAQEIAAGLEAAHARGIVHRDVKPGNIKLTPEGHVKIIDFGLAKATAPAGATQADPHGSQTRAGTIAGTAAYMSPEQARGLATDTRTDIWAFGAVLYELLSGVNAFDGETTSDIVAAVLHRDPDWTALPDDTPFLIRRLLERCLEKDANRRLRDIGDARLEIEDSLTAAPRDANPPRREGRRKTAIAAAAACAVAAVGLTAVWFARRPSTQAHAETVEFRAPFPAGEIPLEGLSVSPSGRLIALEAWNNNDNIWILSPSSADMRPAPGSGHGTWPFWSADDRHLAYFAGGKLVTVNVDTGKVFTVCDAPSPHGGAWNANGDIIFSSNGQLWRTRESGGAPSLMPFAETDPSIHRSLPEYLPDGRRFLFFERRPGGGSIRIGTLDGTAVTTVKTSDSRAGFAPPNYVLFVRGTALVAQVLNLDTLALEGEPQIIAENVGPGYLNADALFSASATGVLAFDGSLGGTTGRLTWFDRGGRPLDSIDAGGSELLNPAFDAQGKRIAVNRMDPATGDWDVWIQDVGTQLRARVTFSPARDSDAVWSPDGKSIVFVSARDGRPALYRKAVDGSGNETRLYTVDDPDDFLIPSQWTPDNRYILFSLTHRSPLSYRIWALSLEDNRPPVRLFPDDNFPQYSARVSPDGKWVAYASGETGAYQIYVRPFMAAGPKLQVSRNGGAHPRWRADGRELFFWQFPEGIASVQVRASGSSLEAGVESMRIPTPPLGLIDGRPHYDVSPDGERFLLRQPATAVRAATATVILNWMERLNKR